MITRALKWIGLALVALVFSLIGLSALRLLLSVIDKIAVWGGYHLAYWRPLGGSPLDGPIFAAWLGVLICLGIVCWLTVWCLADRPIHWATVLLLCGLTTGVSWFLISHGAFTDWVLGAFVVALISFTLMIIAKLFGFNRLGRWLGEKGQWWWKSVIIPWMVVPLTGFALWWIPLVLLWCFAPGFHATVLNELIPWIVQWIFRPVVELLVDVVREIGHLVRS